MITGLQIFQDIYTARADVLLALSSLFLLVVGVIAKERALHKVAILAVTTLVIVMMMTLQQDNLSKPVYLFSDMIVYDRYGVFMKLLVSIGSIAAIFMMVKDMGATVIGRFEIIILVLLATLGMNIMVSSNNLLMVYIGLELQSLSLYIMAAFNRNSLNSSEAGLKYFILGALSSGILLFGMSLIYGFTGTTSFTVLSQLLATQQTVAVSMPLIVGLVFILVGVAFKISAVPFHMWTPDVYQGSPASVTAFFAMAPKIAAIALLGRLLMDVFAQLQGEWTQVLYALSFASMALGAIAGLVQKNIYRLLAYSSIGHIGYALLGFIAGGVEGFSATLSYMAIYMIMTAATFALILSIRDKHNQAVTHLNDLMGLSSKSRFASYALAFMMFSMAGIPPLAGFFGKLFIFTAIIETQHYVLAVLGVLSSVIACYYYLRIIKIMFFDNAANEDDITLQKSYVINWVAIPCFVFVVGFIFFPDWLNYESTQAVLSLQ